MTKKDRWLVIAILTLFAFITLINFSRIVESYDRNSKNTTKDLGRYQMTVTGNILHRLDTTNGTIVACNYDDVACLSRL